MNKSLRTALLTTTFLLPASQVLAQIFQYLPNANLCAAAPVVSTAAESSHVAKTSQGSLCSAYVVENSVSGFFIVVNATVAPVDGAVTPLFCTPIAANSITIVNWPTPLFASTGITLFVSASANCFTKTTGLTSAFFSANVQ